MFGKTNFLAAAGGGDSMGPAGITDSRLQRFVRKSEDDGGAAIDLALDPGRSAVKIDNRFHQSQTQACAVRAAR